MKKRKKFYIYYVEGKFTVNNTMKYSLFLAAFFAQTLSCSDADVSNFYVKIKPIIEYHLDAIDRKHLVIVDMVETVKNQQEKCDVLNLVVAKYMIEHNIKNPLYVHAKRLCSKDGQNILLVQGPLPSHKPYAFVVSCSK